MCVCVCARARVYLIVFGETTQKDSVLRTGLPGARRGSGFSAALCLRGPFQADAIVAGGVRSLMVLRS